MRLDDHYTDDKNGYSHPNKGWEGDIMGSSMKPVTRMSIDELVKKLDLKCDCEN